MCIRDRASTCRMTKKIWSVASVAQEGSCIQRNTSEAEHLNTRDPGCNSGVMPGAVMQLMVLPPGHAVQVDPALEAWCRAGAGAIGRVDCCLSAAAARSIGKTPQSIGNFRTPCQRRSRSGRCPNAIPSGGWSLPSRRAVRRRRAAGRAAWHSAPGPRCWGPAACP